MIVSLYTSRIVLNTLGVSDFGIYNVVGSLVTSFAFIHSAMSGAVQRFFAFEIGRNNYEKLNKLFNVAIVIHFGVALVIILLVEYQYCGSWVKTYNRISFTNISL
ncbi:hypothetical protein FACS18947_4480 [Bacteroidia bacterium]|nr:hypothetical protein FACS18947_4480 [Bacteroidia bacterium]